MKTQNSSIFSKNGMSHCSHLEDEILQRKFFSKASASKSILNDFELEWMSNFESRVKLECGFSNVEGSKLISSLCEQEVKSASDSKEYEVEDRMSSFSDDEKWSLRILSLGDQEVKLSFDEKEDDMKDNILWFSDDEEEFMWI